MKVSHSDQHVVDENLVDFRLKAKRWIIASRSLQAHKGDRAISTRVVLWLGNHGELVGPGEYCVMCDLGAQSGALGIGKRGPQPGLEGAGVLRAVPLYSGTGRGSGCLP